MAQFYMLVKNPGVVEDHDGESCSAHEYVGKIGKLLSAEDSGYDTTYPTGYEPVYYLLEFEDGKKLSIPYQCMIGIKNDEEVWETYLKFQYQK